jgi:hypothetical protein
LIRGADFRNPFAAYFARWLSGGIVVVLLLGGCAAPLQSARLLKAPPAGLAQAVELDQVPFFPQRRYQCGPAALATVLSWSGAAVSPDELVSEVYLPARRGTLQIELAAAARRHGRVPYVLAPEVAALLTEVSAGRPVVVLENLGLSWYPRWHYAVIVGFDLSRDLLILRSGTQRRERVSLEVFERTWRRGGAWAMVTLSPDALPRTATELPYLRTVLPFEELGEWATAARAYATALRRWPDSTGAAMGLGNSLYALKDYGAAADAYRGLLTRRPAYAPALNNLAESLAAAGDLTAAERYAREAVKAGGGEAVYETTLQEIHNRLSQ